MLLPPPRPTLFPYTTLFRSLVRLAGVLGGRVRVGRRRSRTPPTRSRPSRGEEPESVDRKSTRLNSSHLGISYAVFCLKKKTKEKKSTLTKTHEREAHTRVKT